jgi:arylsulfatase A-like enzyme
MLRRSLLKSITTGAAALPFKAAAEGEKPNVILIALDQLHAGRLHSYGNPRATSPNLDRLAAEGVRLAHFYASSPWTAPSYASMHTSQHPSRHGATLFHPPGVPGLKPETATLAESFKKAGYRTAAFVNNSVAGAYLTARGFDDYDEAQRRPTNITERSSLRNQEFRAPATNQRIFHWLDEKGKNPFFLFLLYFEPHSPYDPPPEHDLFKSDAYPEATHTGYDVRKGHLLRKASLRDAKAIERLYQLYDGKIHYIDYYIGELVDRLRRDGLDKNTILLLTSDHGELVYQHIDDYVTFDHRSLYDNVLHVPFYLWGRGVPKGKVVESLGSHIDIAPTLLELAGLPPKADAQGVSLVPVISGKKASVRTHTFSEQDIIEPLRSVRDERYKLIWNKRTGAKLLFDYRADRGEKRDLAATHPGVVARFTKLLEQWSKENETEFEWRDRKWREIAAKAPPELIIDEVTIGSRLNLTGSGWQSADPKDAFGGGVFWSEPRKPGEPERVATWRPDNPLLGSYRVSIWYGALPEGAATEAPFTVSARQGAKRITVDQSTRGGAWQELGVFEDPLNVTLSNAANGRVIVDAVKFERLG